MSEAFTPAESQALRDAKIAVFEDRIILQAQPPIDEETLRAIAAKCAGPIPEDLASLWRTAFGGTVAYDLRAKFGAEEAAFSFSELFFPGSDGYRDLWGWIEHEAELVEGKVKHLPFGGFEYLCRLQAVTEEGSEHGAVVAWMKGRPTSAPLAPGVRAAFRRLSLEVDPMSGDVNATGALMLEEIEGVASLGAAGASAASKLTALLQSAVVAPTAPTEPTA